MMSEKQPSIATTPPKVVGTQRKDDPQKDKRVSDRLEQLQAQVRYKDAIKVPGYRYNGPLPEVKQAKYGSNLRTFVPRSENEKFGDKNTKVEKATKPSTSATIKPIDLYDTEPETNLVIATEPITTPQKNNDMSLSIVPIQELTKGRGGHAHNTAYISINRVGLLTISGKAAEKLGFRYNDNRYNHLLVAVSDKNHLTYYIAVCDKDAKEAIPVRTKANGSIPKVSLTKMCEIFWYGLPSIAAMKDIVTLKLPLADTPVRSDGRDFYEIMSNDQKAIQELNKLK